MIATITSRCVPNVSDRVRTGTTLTSVIMCMRTTCLTTVPLSSLLSSCLSGVSRPCSTRHRLQHDDSNILKNDNFILTILYYDYN